MTTTLHTNSEAPAAAASSSALPATTGLHVAVVGATSAIAQHCLRLWAERRPARLSLMGRDTAQLARMAADLRVRSPGTVIETLPLTQATDPAAIEALVQRVCAAAPVDMALIAHGLLPDQAQCEQDLQANAEALAINGLSPVLFAEAFVRHMQQAGRGTVGVIGSVAGDRGRKSNYVYGAGKGMVARYLQGLQHRLALTQSPVRAVLIKPGPTDTPMTAHLKARGARLAPVEDVARITVRAMDQGRPVAYAPGRWALIMAVVRSLPAFVFNRIDI